MDYAAKKGLNTLRETPNRGDWITQPAIVNAFYSPSDNSISEFLNKNVKLLHLSF